jgi:protein SCO1/2
MTPKTRTGLLALAALAAVLLGVVAGIGWFPAKEAGPTTITLLPSPRPVDNFTLSGADGKPFTHSDLRERWTLIFAGYTYCPDVCPTTLTQLKETMTKLGDDAGSLQILFLSVDPERDTPERLAKYVHYFDPRFRAATGPVPALENLGKALGFVFAKVPGKTPDSYTIDHSAAMMLVNPQAQLAGYIVPPFATDALAHDLKAVMDR